MEQHNKPEILRKYRPYWWWKDDIGEIYVIICYAHR